MIGPSSISLSLAGICPDAFSFKALAPELTPPYSFLQLWGEFSWV
jgi:hypothetical protein